MQAGDIVVVSFPYTDFTSFKARPAVVVSTTKDFYDDVIVALITSVVKEYPSPFQIKLFPDSINNLRAPSIIKVSRLATIEKNKILSVIGKLAAADMEEFKRVFKLLVD